MQKHVVEKGNLQHLFILASATQQDLSTWI